MLCVAGYSSLVKAGLEVRMMEYPFSSSQLARAEEEGFGFCQAVVRFILLSVVASASARLVSPAVEEDCGRMVPSYLLYWSTNRVTPLIRFVCSSYRDNGWSSFDE